METQKQVDSYKEEMRERVRNNTKIALKIINENNKNKKEEKEK